MTRIEQAAKELAIYLRDNSAPAKLLHTAQEAEWPVSIKADNEADAIKLAELLTNLEQSLVAAGHIPSPNHHE